MSYRFEKTEAGTDIVFDGFEKGIADSPFLGIADMRNVNITSQPQEASVNFSTEAMTIPPTVSADAFTVATNDIFTVASTSGFYNGMAITFNTIVTAVGFSTGRAYWVGDITPTTFKIYKTPALSVSQLVDVTTAGSGTYSTYTLTTVIDKAIAYGGANTSPAYPLEFLLDDSGRVWWIYNPGGTVTNSLSYLGNTTLTGTTGRAIAVFQGYLIVFRTSTTDYVDLASVVGGNDLNSRWAYGWESVDTVEINPRPVISAQDDALYYANAKRVGSILENAGEVFDPTSGVTYTKTVAALRLGNEDQVTALAELGVYLLVGGTFNYLYVWDRVSTSYNYPLILAENYVHKIVSTNANAYIFAGYRGRIYVTNGSNIDLWKKIPDSVTGYIEPYFDIGDAQYWRNQLYFSFTATTNAGVAINTMSGVWAIDLATEAFRYTTKLSYGAYTGTTTVILPNVLSSTPAGDGLYIGWTNSGTYGVDVSSADPYTGGQTYIDFDIIPVGTFLTKKTFQNVEWKLSTPLVSGESVAIYYRTDITGAYTLLGTTNTAGLVSDQPYPVTFEMTQWLQLRAVLTSTDSSPSYVRLREVRLR